MLWDIRHVLSFSQGAASGVLLSLVLNAWITIGGVLYGRRPVPLPPVPGNSCMVLDVNTTGTNMQVFKMEDILSTADNSPTTAWTTIERSRQTKSVQITALPHSIME